MRFEQTPPIPQAYYVQKLPQPTTEGQNIIFSVTYLAEPNLPEKLYLSPIGNQNLILHDDGKYPDLVAGNLKYSTLMTEDIQTFKDQIHRLEDKIDADGGVISFTGHDGHFTKAEEIIKFDFTLFDTHVETPIDARLINAQDCDQYIAKDRSLFITDIKVVEDPIRTHNFIDNSGNGSGNKQGAWTFGHLLGNIINNPNNVNSFIENWLNTFLTNQTNPANGETSVAREDALFHLIIPWIKLSYKTQNPNLNSIQLHADWQVIENNVTQNVAGFTWHDYLQPNIIPGNILLENAPFKLTAIVNRIDLRGNVAYSNLFSDAGETRFIFSLIQIDPLLYIGVPIDDRLPTHQNPPGDLFDWKGMNLIMEFANPQTNVNDLQTFANDWLDLSSPTLTMGSTYNDALELITNKVTDVNAMPNKPNGSGINRIRTNEKIFQFSASDVSQFNNASWLPKFWQFRQFELNSTGNLETVPVTNVPMNSSNYAEFNSNIMQFEGLTTTIVNGSPQLGQISGSYNSTKGQALLSWALANQNHVLNDNYNIPKHLLALTGDNFAESLNFFAIDNNPNLYPAADDIIAKNLRHHISLNTCQGCHAGETQTLFTMVAPTVYGQYIDYTSSTPTVPNSILNVKVDGLNSSSMSTVSGFGNPGETFEWYKFNSGQYSNSINRILPTVTSAIIPTISPFLTGRRFEGNNILSASWQDDNTDPSDLKDNDLSVNKTQYADDQLTGLFWVNDPDNQSPSNATRPYSGIFPFNNDRKHGYNDLERRKTDLCVFIGENLSGTAFRAIKRTKFIPLPVGAH